MIKKRTAKQAVLFVYRKLLHKICSDIFSEVFSVWTFVYCLVICIKNASSNDFKEMLRSGNCEGISKIIKTLYLHEKVRLDAGKKAVSLDEKYLFIAREHLYGELSVSLGIAKNDMEVYIAQCIEGENN